MITFYPVLSSLLTFVAIFLQRLRFNITNQTLCHSLLTLRELFCTMIDCFQLEIWNRYLKSSSQKFYGRSYHELMDRYRFCIVNVSIITCSFSVLTFRSTLIFASKSAKIIFLKERSFHVHLARRLSMVLVLGVNLSYEIKFVSIFQ